MMILNSSPASKLSYDLSADSISASRDVLQRRRDYDDRLANAFDELVSIAQADETESGSIDSIIESGLYFSAKSSFHSELAGAFAELNSAGVGSDSDEDGAIFQSPQAYGFSRESLPWSAKKASTF